MSTINTSQNSISSSSRSTSTTSSSSTNVRKPDVSGNETSSNDRVSLSSESRSGSGNQGASLSLLDGLRANYASEGTSKTEQSDQVAGKSELGKPQDLSKDSLSADQKLDNLKSTIDSLKGLKGEELQARLEEIKKTDPELAEYLKKMLEKDEKAEDKKEVAEAKPAEKAKSGGDDGAPSETFLWKPVSDSDGKLVILLPSSLSATSVSVSGPNFNETVEKGGRNGSRGNGQREHYRFGKSGKDMQGPVQVTVALENGSSKTINIAKPAERNEGGKLSDGQQ
jgi:hypothetical protein